MPFKPLLFGAVFLFFLFLCHVERSRNIQAKPHVWLRHYLTLAAECLVTRNTRSRGIRKMPYRSVNKAFGGKRKTKKLNEKAPETGMQKMNIFRAEKIFQAGLTALLQGKTA